MKHPITMMYTLLMCWAICSCSKNRGPDEPANEGSMLKMYKTSHAGSNITYRIYERDANNRIIWIRDSSFSYLRKYNLIYASNGKLEKVIFYIETPTPAYSYEFVYNSDGRISKRITKPGAAQIPEDYTTYEYDAAGHLTADSIYSPYPNGYTLYIISKFKYTGDNITEAEYFSGRNWTTPNDWCKYEYDNGINPLAPLEYEYYITESHSAITTITKKSGNNVTKYYYGTVATPLALQTNTNYKYNSSKFAWKEIVTNILTQYQLKDTTEYFYQ